MWWWEMQPERNWHKEKCWFIKITSKISDPVTTSKTGLLIEKNQSIPLQDDP